MSQRQISTADRISSLPDGVLCHILSFLPTKRAVATSVLSKRWTHLWRSVLTLDFDYYDREWKDLDFDNYDTEEEDRRACSRFNEFVYSVLLSRDAALSIRSFRLNCISYNNLPNVSKWVNFVIQRRVEYLHLLAYSNDKPKLPISILSCATLVVLKFREFVVKGFSSVGLPSLKILRLEYIGFPEVRDFMLLLAGCPILEDLHASYIEFDFDSDSEDSLTCQEFKSFSLSKLTRAVIIGCYCPSLLKALYNVESLRIEIDKMYCCDDDIPTFHNLTRLELFSLNFDWHLLVEVLENCPKLQHLALCQHKVGDSRRIDEDLQENWVDPGFVPQCLSLHLRTCTLLTFFSLRGEFLLARYILKNARVLQTMKFWSRQRSKIKRKLSSCPRASATCEISFPPSVPLFY